jgi:peptidoglycan/LPS O-acetylase OafA/YrhL
LLATPLTGWHWSAAWLAWPLYVGNYLRFWHPYIAHTAWQRIADTQPGHPATALFLGHLWSLCVEEQFYLVWPWVVFFVRSRRALLWICGGAVVLVPLLRVFVQHHASQNMLDAELLYRVTPFRIDALLLGGLLSLGYRGAQREWILRAGRWLFWLCTAAAIAYMVATVHPDSDYVYPAWKYTWGLCFVDVYAASALLACLHPGSILYRVFRLRALRWLGRISYGAYVFHDIFHLAIMSAVRHYVTPGRVQNTDEVIYIGTVVAFVLTIVLAWLSFRWFETPFLNLKERWTVR